MTEHSPLGGSAAPRFIKCPASVWASRGMEDSESEYAALGTAALGTAAHALAEACLHHKMSAWEGIGGSFNGIVVDKEMADAVQVYLDAVRREHPDANHNNSWVERAFRCSELHELYWGQADFVYLEEDCYVEGPEYGGAATVTRLHVWDYKHGVGIIVEANSEQLKYYACGMLQDFDLWDWVDEVVLWVAQPRGFHPVGPIRSWTASVEELRRWLDEELLPAMDAAAWVASRDATITGDELIALGLLRSGEHCRFCPARFANCPRLEMDMKELAKMTEQTKDVRQLTNEQLGRYLDLFETAKIVQKAAREVAFARAQEGHEVPGWKLARARSNREWRDGADAAATEKFGNDAWPDPALKSPAQIEGLPGGRAFASEWALKPDGGLQLVRDADARPEAGPKGWAMFEPVKKEKNRA